jgi:hypothetical protein
VLVLVVFSLALVTRAPHTRGGDERSSRAWSVMSAAPAVNSDAAGARQRRPATAAWRPHQRVARPRGHPPGTRSQRTVHRRRRSRPIAPRPMAPAPAPPIAAAPALPIVVPQRGAASVRRLASRPLRSPDPSFTPGDLPPGGSGAP